MRLARVAKSLGSMIEWTARALSSAGSGILAVLMFFTALDVALRYFFGSPLKGDYEISAFMMALLIPSGLALCALKKGHIAVDVLTARLPQRMQAALNCFAYLVTLGLVCLMVWQSAVYASTLVKANTAATSVPIPYYPFVIVLTICLIVFALATLHNLVESIREFLHGRRSDGGA